MVGMIELPQRTSMKKRCVAFILKMTVKNPCSTLMLYEALNKKYPKYGPKKGRIAKYCAELENRGFLIREGKKPITWRFKTKRDFE